MNIAIFASAFHPHVGGVEELCRQLGLELQRRGHQVIILTNRWPRDLPASDDVDGLPVHRLPFRLPECSAKSRISYSLTSGAVRKRLNRILSDFGADVLHVQCISSNAYYAMQAKADLGVPLVVTAQGELTMDAGHMYESDTFMNRHLAQVLEAADMVTGCSQKTIDDVLKHSGAQVNGRSRRVFNGAKISDFAEGIPYVHRRPYILGIGRGVPQKGFDVLIRAVAQLGLSTHDVLIAGEGPETHHWKELATSLGVADRMHFVGQADHERAVALFLGADFVVLPSRSDEGLPVVCAETMAAGKALVATRVGGVPEAVVDGETGLIVEREDVDGLAMAVRKLADDPALRERLGTAGRKRAELFSWEAVTKRYLEVYESVCA